MFEDVSSLYVQYQKFLQGLPYTFLHSTWQLENWVEHRAGRIDDDSMIKTWAQLDAEFIRDTGAVVSQHKAEQGESEGSKKFNHQNLLRSLNHSLNHEDVESIFLSHKFNDHNLR